MKISFDLDDTIIPGVKQFDTQNKNLIQKLFRVELIRKDSIKLIKELRDKKHKVGIYTTSLRSTRNIRFMFFLYGTRLDFIVNHQKHVKKLQRSSITSSKHPPSFGIDFHIDDSKGVEMEGEKYNFRTVIIEETDYDWVDTVLNAVK